jgi:uncharacterized protein (TIGR02266 family)
MQPNLALIPPSAEGPSSSDPVDFQLKLDCDTVAEFTERYANDISRGGIFIRTRKPLAVGTKLKLDLRIWNGEPLIVGEGTVFWTREPDMTGGDSGVLYPGMGVRFGKLTRASQELINHTLSERAKRKRSNSMEIPGIPSPMDAGPGSQELLASGVPEEATPAVPMSPHASGQMAVSPGAAQGADRHATPLATPIQTSAAMKAASPPSAPTKAAAASSGPVKATPASSASSGPIKAASPSLPEPNVAATTRMPLVPAPSPLPPVPSAPVAATPAKAAASPSVTSSAARKKRFLMAGSAGLLLLVAGAAMVATSGGKKSVTSDNATGAVATQPAPAPTQPARDPAPAGATPSPAPQPTAATEPAAAAAPVAVAERDPGGEATPSAAEQDSPADHQKGKTRAAPSRRDIRAAKPADRHAAPTVVAMAATAHRPAGRPGSDGSPAESPAAPAARAEERQTAPPPAVVAVAVTPPAAHVAASPKEELRPAPGGGASAPSHKLRLTSIPSDADVLLDGKAIGKTPLFGVEIDVSRPHALLIRKDGYAPFQQAITAGSDWTVKASDRSVSTLKISALLKQ